MPRLIPGNRQYTHLIADIEQGNIKVPQFQRDFVWEISKSAKLIDSVVKGYPIGAFILWKTNEQLRSIRNIGGLNFPEKTGENIEYVLDGQQRMTSLYCCLKGSKINKEDGRALDYSNIYVNLHAEESDELVVAKTELDDEKKYIKLIDLLSDDFELLAKYPKEVHSKIKEYRNRVSSYNFPIISISDATLDIATEVFTRINLGGKDLTLFEIMVAKTYDAPSNFDLSEKCKSLFSRLKIIDYETISDSTILQAVAAILTKECTAKRILQLKKHDIIEKWDEIADAVERACEYLKSYYRIPVSQLLPYNALIVPFSYFFFYHKDKPIGDKQKYLEDFFWRCSLSARYSSGTESKLGQDISKIESILVDQLPSYEWEVNANPEFIINNGYFSAARSFIKAILCIYAYQQPKSFIDNSIVNISNYWLKQANSKNYHHFFPKASLACKGKEWGLINNILNITIVDDFLNKRSIKAKNPSDYMQKFISTNQAINNTMMTHLIGDFQEFGILTDDFEKFISSRAILVSTEINKRIISRTSLISAPSTIDDYEDVDENELETSSED